MIRKAKWLAVYVFSFSVGMLVYPFVFMATPLTGYWPKSPVNIHRVALKHATEGIGAGLGGKSD